MTILDECTAAAGRYDEFLIGDCDEMVYVFPTTENFLSL